MKGFTLVGSCTVVLLVVGSPTSEHQPHSRPFVERTRYRPFACTFFRPSTLYIHTYHVLCCPVVRNFIVGNSTSTFVAGKEQEEVE